MTPGSNAAVFFGEFIGTAILLLMGNGVVAAVLLPRSKAFAGGWIVITFGWGFAVLAGAHTPPHLAGGPIQPAGGPGARRNRRRGPVLGGVHGSFPRRRRGHARDLLDHPRDPQ